MAQQDINIGAADAGLGDDYFTAFKKTQENFDDIYSLIASGARVIVSELADFPAPAAGVITLLPSTQYFLTENVSLGTNRITFSDNSVISSIDSIVITLSYTGTGDMFTFLDTTARINNISLDAPNARLFNWTDTTFKILRIVDITIVSCDKIGRFNGSMGVIRFTNVSPASITSDGCEFLGNFRSFLWEVSAGTINAGAYLNLGTATFDSIITNTLNVVLNGTSNLISGAAASANINTGGIGIVQVSLTSGTGTPLSGISVDDALWEFRSNDDIRDTRPDALLSLQGNAVAETITVSGTPVKVTGNNAWADERSSQSTNDNTGKSTYDGGKPIVVPITMRGSIEPASGTNKLITLYVALNGVPIAGSAATANVDAGDPKSVTVIWQEEATPGDFVEMYVSNDTDTIDVLVSSGIIRIN